MLCSVAPNKDRTRSSACWRELLGGWGLGWGGVGTAEGRPAEGRPDEGATGECTLKLGAGVPCSLATSACKRTISPSFCFSADARSRRSRSSSFSSAAISSLSRCFSVWNSRLISCSRSRRCSSSSRLLLASSRRCSMISLRRSSSLSSRVCLRSSTLCRLGGCLRNHHDHGCADLPTAKNETTWWDNSYNIKVNWICQLYIQCTVLSTVRTDFRRAFHCSCY